MKFNKKLNQIIFYEYIEIYIKLQFNSKFKVFHMVHVMIFSSILILIKS